jgi:hypothetical protein
LLEAIAILQSKFYCYASVVRPTNQDMIKLKQFPRGACHAIQEVARTVREQRERGNVNRSLYCGSHRNK